MMKLVLLALCAAAVAVEIPESLKVDVAVKEKSVDMKSSLMTNKYCSVSGRKLIGTPYRSQFAPDLHQCLTRCNRDVLCQSADFTSEKICNLHLLRMVNNDVAQLGLASGTHYYRRFKLEPDCPKGTTPHVSTRTAYSSTFCKIAGKKCPGGDLYRKSQSLEDMTKCMEKCAKIKTCASADYSSGKCAPKDHACSAGELVEETGATYLLRLAKGESDCPTGSAPEAPVVKQPEPDLAKISVAADVKQPEPDVAKVSVAADVKQPEPDVAKVSVAADVKQPEPEVAKVSVAADVKQPEPDVAKVSLSADVAKTSPKIGTHKFLDMYYAIYHSIADLKQMNVDISEADLSSLQISDYVDDEGLIRQMLTNLRAWYGMDKVREYLVDGADKESFDYYKEYYGY